MINKTKTIKRMTALLLAMIMVLTCVPAALAAPGSKPSIKKISYERNGRVEVEFYGDVKYYKYKLSVKDANGKSVRAYFTDRESYEDDLEFRTGSYKSGMTYTFTISGIKRAYSSGSYTTITGKYTVPSKYSLKLEDIDYDYEDRELSFDFQNNVYWKNRRPTVKITTMGGTTKTTRFLEKDNDSIEVRANLTPGQKYKYTIYGVKARGASAYQNVSGTFIARYDD